ncbi:MAG: hypothetical protein ACLS9G_05630, partial [Akkermansia sp.]
GQDVKKMASRQNNFQNGFLFPACSENLPRTKKCQETGHSLIKNHTPPFSKMEARDENQATCRIPV